jgi:hypothetical protein
MSRMLLSHVFLEIIPPFAPTIVAIWFLTENLLVAVHECFMTASTSPSRERFIATKITTVVASAGILILRVRLCHHLVLKSRDFG